MLDCVADAGSEIIEESKVEKKTAQKIFNMMAWYPMVMAIGVFLVALISFIANSGFANEIALIKSEGLGAIEDIWTEGTSGYFYNPWICISVGAVYLVLAGAAAIKVYKPASESKKRILTALLVLINLGAPIAGFAMISEVGFSNALKMIGVNSSEYMPIAVVTILFVSACLIVCTFMLFTDETFLTCFLSALFYFAGAPLICLIIENIIVILVIVVVVLFGALLFGHSAPASSNKSGVKFKKEVNKSHEIKRQQVSDNCFDDIDAEIYREKEIKRRQKIQDKIDALERDIEKRNRAIEKHNKGVLGYDGGVNPKTCMNSNIKAREEIEFLKAELNKS